MCRYLKTTSIFKAVEYLVMRKVFQIARLMSTYKALQDWQGTYSLLNNKTVVTYKDLEHLYSSKWKRHQILNDMTNKGLIERSGQGTKYITRLGVKVYKSKFMTKWVAIYSEN